MTRQPAAATTGETVQAKAAPPRRRGPLWLGLRALSIAFFSFLGFVAVLYTFQDRLIFPGAATQGRPDSVIRARPGEELVKLATDGGEVVAIYGPALDANGRPLPDPSSRPALVFFYGNAMCAAYCAPLLDRFRRLGLNVMIPDYLGYGMSGGRASELGCRATAEACYQSLRKRGFPPERIFVGGWSLGAAVAIDLASRQPAAGLFAFSAFTNLQDMARGIIPIPLPGLLFAHKFDNLAKIGGIKCPILLGHGRRDSIIPFSMFERLKAAAKAPLSTLILDDADHNDFFDVGGERIDEAIKQLTAPRR